MIKKDREGGEDRDIFNGSVKRKSEILKKNEK